jgi:hypothetical protein
MLEHIEGLKSLCFEDLNEAKPFHVRTRFERHLFGLAYHCSLKAFGSSPNGLTRTHLAHFLSTLPHVGPGKRGEMNHEAWGRACLERISDLYERFTALCDTSNWSDDGQDPRIKSCRAKILNLCAYAERQ